MNYDYKKFWDEKLKFVVGNSYTILNVGSGRAFKKMLADYEKILAGKKYVTMDFDPSTKPDVVGDTHAMPFENNSFDAILHTSVLEHLYDPKKAVKEMFRVLKPGGYMLCVVPFMQPYHAKEGHYQDYWRFSKDGLNKLFENFSEVTLFKIGRYFRAMINYLPFFWRFERVLEPVAYILDQNFIKESRNSTAAFIIFAKK